MEDKNYQPPELCGNCPVCDYNCNTLCFGDICPKCYWEIDDLDNPLGFNHKTLDEAKADYKRIGFANVGVAKRFGKL